MASGSLWIALGKSLGRLWSGLGARSAFKLEPQRGLQRVQESRPVLEKVTLKGQECRLVLEKVTLQVQEGWPVLEKVAEKSTCAGTGDLGAGGN